MANKKYKFIKGHNDTRIVLPALNIEVTKDNLNEEYTSGLTYGELVNKKFKHLADTLEEVEEKEESSTKSGKKKNDVAPDSGIEINESSENIE